MDTIYTNKTVSVTELKRNFADIIKQADECPVAILNHNRPTAYLVPAETYEQLMERLEDYQFGLIIKERQNEKISAVEVNIDEL